MKKIFIIKHFDLNPALTGSLSDSVSDVIELDFNKIGEQTGHNVKYISHETAVKGMELQFIIMYDLVSGVDVNKLSTGNINHNHTY